MLCFSRGLESGNKVASMYYCTVKTNKNQCAQLFRLQEGYWFVYRECMERLLTGILDVSSVTQFAKVLRKIEGRELLKDIPSGIVYRACADAGYDKLYGRVNHREKGFALPDRGYILSDNNKLTMHGVTGDMPLKLMVADLPSDRLDASFLWLPRQREWCFGFWSSQTA